MSGSLEGYKIKKMNKKSKKLDAKKGQIEIKNGEKDGVSSAAMNC